MVRNKAAHAVSGHEAKGEHRCHKFNELDHQNLPSLGRFSVVLQCDKNATIGLLTGLL
jgi:hypothetical protein